MKMREGKGWLIHGRWWRTKICLRFLQRITKLVGLIEKSERTAKPMNRSERLKRQERKHRDMTKLKRQQIVLPSMACAFLNLGSGWFSLFHNGGTAKTSVVPNCSKAMAFQNETHVVRVSPAS
jgi:hypothetical protein